MLPSKEWKGIMCTLGYANSYTATFKVTKFALFSTSLALKRMRKGTSGNLMLKKHGPGIQEVKRLNWGTVFLAFPLNTM